MALQEAIAQFLLCPGSVLIHGMKQRKCDDISAWPHHDILDYHDSLEILPRSKQKEEVPFCRVMQDDVFAPS